MKRPWMLAGAVLFVFIAVAGIILPFMPRPLKDADYLVVGSVATLASLVTAFLMLAMAKGSRGVFFKKRRK